MCLDHVFLSKSVSIFVSLLNRDEVHFRNVFWCLSVSWEIQHETDCIKRHIFLKWIQTSEIPNHIDGSSCLCVIIVHRNTVIDNRTRNLAFFIFFIFSIYCTPFLYLFLLRNKWEDWFVHLFSISLVLYRHKSNLLSKGEIFHVVLPTSKNVVHGFLPSRSEFFLVSMLWGTLICYNCLTVLYTEHWNLPQS